MSCHVPKPREAALQAALRTCLSDRPPPTLVPHPPVKKVAWRTRRIVEELKALTSVDALTQFEAELRGLVGSQEVRCRTKLITHAWSEECSMREREQLACEEATQREAIARESVFVARSRFSLLHVQLVEESTRRSLRRHELCARRQVMTAARSSLLLLAEAAARTALTRQEGLMLQELQSRRVIELGHCVQRGTIVQRRLSGHIQSVTHSRCVEAARQQLIMQEAKDRAAVVHLHELHTLLLLRKAEDDFSTRIQRDVLCLSTAEHVAATGAEDHACAMALARCVEEEMRLRSMTEASEAAEAQTVTQSFLLGWRAVYKQVTRDPNVFSVFSKIELLVRRDIADQERREYNALASMSHAHWAAVRRQRSERRALCQAYITRARALWEQECREANVLFEQHHHIIHEAATLQATTVLATEEVAARRAVRGAEAQARLELKVDYLFHTLQQSCADVASRIQAEEAEAYEGLCRQLGEVRFAQPLQRTELAESNDRLLLEHAESVEAADAFLLLRQALLRFRAGEVCRPLVAVEDAFRQRVWADEARERQRLARRGVALEEKAHRCDVVEEEWERRCAAASSQLRAAEEGARRVLSADAELRLVGLFATATLAQAELSRVERARADEAARAGAVAEDGPLPSAVESPTGFTEPWSDLCAEWEYDVDIASASVDGAASSRLSSPPVVSPYGPLCEDVLVEAFLARDLIHFTEHQEWRRLLHRQRLLCQGTSSADLGCGIAAPASWALHSVSVRQEPHQRASSVNIWDSSQSFDATFPLVQQQEEGIVGERTIAFYVPEAAAEMPRWSAPGMLFFLILDAEGSVLASATTVVEATSPASICLCVALDNGAGYLRFT